MQIPLKLKYRTRYPRGHQSRSSNGIKKLRGPKKGRTIQGLGPRRRQGPGAWDII